jgi:hypothetical protein
MKAERQTGMDGISIYQLRDLLFSARTIGGADFSGLGVVVYTSLEWLPIVPLRSSSTPDQPTFDVAFDLATVANLRSEFHDGFHMISTDGKLTHVAQYFSPPIVRTAAMDRSRRFGGRYLAALFGSAIGGVHLTGIVSNNFGLAIFRKLQEVHFEVLA